MASGLDLWDGSIEHARALRDALAQRVVLRDGYTRPLRVIAGLTVDFEDDGERAHAVGVLVDAESLDLIDAQVAYLPATMPYVPGLLTFRAMPALLRVMEMLPQPPDLALLEGHGCAHGGAFGVASHFGVATGIPSIGVGDRPMRGTGAAVHDIRGAYTPLREMGEQIGWLLRSHAREAPIVVSPGHRVAMASAADLVMRFTTTERQPEPLHLAQTLAAHKRTPLDDAPGDLHAR